MPIKEIKEISSSDLVLRFVNSIKSDIAQYAEMLCIMDIRMVVSFINVLMMDLKGLYDVLKIKVDPEFIKELEEATTKDTANMVNSILEEMKKENMS